MASTSQCCRFPNCSSRFFVILISWACHCESTDMLLHQMKCSSKPSGHLVMQIYCSYIMLRCWQIMSLGICGVHMAVQKWNEKMSIEQFQKHSHLIIKDALKVPVTWSVLPDNLSSDQWFSLPYVRLQKKSKYAHLTEMSHLPCL